jgi:hypothetical protein
MDLTSHNARITTLDVKTLRTLDASGVAQPVATGGRLTFTETTAPAAPAANAANLWVQDNGSGKTQLMIQFATGAAIAIATQA